MSAERLGYLVSGARRADSAEMSLRLDEDPADSISGCPDLSLTHHSRHGHIHLASRATTKVILHHLITDSFLNSIQFKLIIITTIFICLLIIIIKLSKLNFKWLNPITICLISIHYWLTLLNFKMIQFNYKLSQSK